MHYGVHSWSHCVGRTSAGPSAAWGRFGEWSQRSLRCVGRNAADNAPTFTVFALFGNLFADTNTLYIEIYFSINKFTIFIIHVFELRLVDEIQNLLFQKKKFPLNCDLSDCILVIFDLDTGNIRKRWRCCTSRPSSWNRPESFTLTPVIQIVLLPTCVLGKGLHNDIMSELTMTHTYHNHVVTSRLSNEWYSTSLRCTAYRLLSDIDIYFEEKDTYYVTNTTHLF